MQASDHDVAHRLPVWLALSELYLDTELSSAALAHIAAVLAASPYTIGELRYILLHEVHPACVANLLTVAGVWSGFDADWLRQRIQDRSRARLRWPARLLPFRRTALASAAPLFACVPRLREVR